jgi:PIN domain nuclease of toxin-antitoxin system
MVMVLLDSNALLWVLGSPEKLGKVARSKIEAASELCFSAASMFELTFKSQKLGRNGLPLLQLRDDFLSAVVAAGFTEIPVRSEHASDSKSFPAFESGDPFDRIILCQAKREGALLVTSDEKMLAQGLDWIIDAQN